MCRPSRLGEVVSVNSPEVAVGSSVVVRVRGVHATLILSSCGAPCADVVALLDFEGCDAVRNRCACCLCPYFTLVKPDRSAEDGKIDGLIDVYSLTWGAVDFGDKEGDTPHVEGPATGGEADGDVAVEIVRVSSWGDLEEFGSEFGCFL